jgi:amino-acid N-acetyltransferase
MSKPADRRAVRPATVDDVPVIYALLRDYAAQGNLLPRSEDEIYHQLRDFFVIGQPGQPLACGALETFTAELGEVRSLMVAPAHLRQGHGQRIVGHIIGQARDQGLSRLMALTYVPGFFHNLGFRTVPKDTLPEKVWGVCVRCYRFQSCDEIAVVRKL